MNYNLIGTVAARYIWTVQWALYKFILYKFDNTKLLRIYFWFIINLLLANMRYGVYCQYMGNLWTKSSFMSVINIFSRGRLLYLAGICVCWEMCRLRPLGWSRIMTCYSQCAILSGHTDQFTLHSTSNRILWYRKLGICKIGI